MKTCTLFALLMLGIANLHAQASSVAAYVTGVISDSVRPVADRQRDNERKPVALVAFAGIKPGDRVADVMSGGGYFTPHFQ
jgi:predicted methyltransferase